MMQSGLGGDALLAPYRSVNNKNKQTNKQTVRKINCFCPNPSG